EVEEPRKHLMIVPNEEDDVYTKATPLARKVPVVDYEIYNENNKPYYKIRRAGGSHQLYLSFLSMLRNFDREYLEVLWQLVKERFASRKKKEDNAVKRYQSLKRKPQTEAQARKNMMIYLSNVAGFKMDYFKGMTYDDIRLIFEKYFNSNVAFLQKTKEKMD
nr:hypothetical protein [Tanacetum cinerariifolium]